MLFLTDPFLLLAAGDDGRHPFLGAAGPPLEELAKAFQSDLAIAGLGSVLAGLDHDAGGQVADADPGLRHVPVLATGSGATVEFNFQIRLGNFDHGAPPAGA